MHRLVRDIRFEYPIGGEEARALCHFHLFERDKRYIAIATDISGDHQDVSVLTETIADFATSVARDFFIDPIDLRVFLRYDDRNSLKPAPRRIDGESFSEATFRWIQVYNAGARIDLPRALEPRFARTDRASLEQILGRALE